MDEGMLYFLANETDHPEGAGRIVARLREQGELTFKWKKGNGKAEGKGIEAFVDGRWAGCFWKRQFSVYPKRKPSALSPDYIRLVVEHPSAQHFPKHTSPSHPYGSWALPYKAA